MTTFFQFIMYIVFGKRWLKFEMKHGLKSAIFVHEAEIAMRRSHASKIREDLENYKSEIARLETEPLPDSQDLLPEEEKNDSEKVFAMDRKIQGERAELITTYKNQIKATEDELDKEEGELGKLFSLAYGTRLKYDFVKDYKIKPTYADKNYVKED